jgi:hypothetical protein
MVSRAAPWNDPPVHRAGETTAADVAAADILVIFEITDPSCARTEAWAGTLDTRRRHA